MSHNPLDVTPAPKQPAPKPLRCPPVLPRCAQLVNPPAATEEAVALVRAVEAASGARLQHVVILSLFPDHWYGAPDWAPYCAPDVTLWVVPGEYGSRSRSAKEWHGMAGHGPYCFGGGEVGRGALSESYAGGGQGGPT
jgi:hypothetical protein